MPRVVLEPEAAQHEAARTDAVRQGTLQALDAEGRPGADCPLEHTDVQAEISGFLARVTLRQVFVNARADKIEALYTFPLSQRAAVDGMTMLVAGRTIQAQIMRSEEARRVYEGARAAGHTAALLRQQRSNVFTQSVANIPPGARLTVTLSYVEALKYEDGAYEFIFPMVVGPRYTPGGARGETISTPVAPAGTRAGHDISIAVSLDAGVPVDEVRSVLHEIDVASPDCHTLSVRLRERRASPNRDFILRYHTAGGQISDALLTHRSGRGGFFTLFLQPPARAAARDVTPREVVFVLDTSGSMSGLPLAKAKETISLALGALDPRDTFNLITFAGATRLLYPAPVAATTAHLSAARSFLDGGPEGGGTEMMQAIRAALAPTDVQTHTRIVCFMTDGYVGNDDEILAEVQRHPQARVFSFGIGQAVNRYLLDKMAEYGRGEVEYVTLDEDGSAAARRFAARIRQPLLTDIELDWGDLPVAEVYPRRVPDLFSARPLVLTGRYTHGGRGVVRLKGRAAGRTVTREIVVELPKLEPRHDVLATLWARTKVDALLRSGGAQAEALPQEIRDDITRLGLNYRLLTPFTSFVAVEADRGTASGPPVAVEVPVELPEGTFGGSSCCAGVAGNASANAFTMSEMSKNIGPVLLTVLLTLLTMAIVVVVISFERAMKFTLAGLHERQGTARILAALKVGQFREAFALSAHQENFPLARIVRAALERTHADEAAPRDDEMDDARAQLAWQRVRTLRRAELDRGLRGLATIAETAPLVGLLGTVFGLHSALTGIEYAEAAGVAAVAGGVAEALLTTALGLFVAVPAVWLKNYFNGRTGQHLLALDKAAAEACNLLQRRPHA